MDNTQRMELLDEICRLQSGTDKITSNGTAPVSIKIGYVTVGGTVMDNGILITDCPPAIVDGISKWIDKVNLDGKFITASVFNGGLLVT